MGISIVDKINEKTGIPATTIAQAVDNLEVGGGDETGNIYIDVVRDPNQHTITGLSVTKEEFINYYASGRNIMLYDRSYSIIYQLAYASNAYNEAKEIWEREDGNQLFSFTSLYEEDGDWYLYQMRFNITKSEPEAWSITDSYKKI